MGESVMKNIPLFIPDIQDSDIDAVQVVLRSGMLVQGKNVEALEAAFCEITGAAYAVAVSNGTATLHLMLHVLGIGKGDEVIIPAFSYIATANAVELVGATPVFVDIDTANWNISVSDIEAQITNRTKAIMPVHEFGLSADLDPIRRICEKYKLHLLEDAACAVGSTYKDAMTGQYSFAASFSLHPRKAITSGEGGIIVTSDAGLADQLRVYRNHGIAYQNGEMDFVAAGFNYRMTDFQAALVLNQTHRLASQIGYKRELAAIYLEELKALNLVLPSDMEYASHTWQTFHVLLPEGVNRAVVLSRLKEAGIGASYGAQCIPDTRYYKEKYAYNAAEFFPTAYAGFHRGLALPMYPLLAEENVLYVAENLKKILEEIQ
ncbi:MAG: DegT/DnrJ/EryC1/StrS family aminotransferase [Bacteroidota bacterium]|jgi:dTDP-4-amino-4,6-dideoxygalactose transaminase